MSKRYELINYSEYGTVVDNILYSCDVSVKTFFQPSSPESKTISTIKNILKKNVKRKTKRLKERNIENCIGSVKVGSGIRTSSFQACCRENCHSSVSTNVERVSVQVQGYSSTSFSYNSQTLDPCACKGTSFVTSSGWEG